MASVRKRTWSHKGTTKEAWVVTYTDGAGVRRLKTFKKKKDADEFQGRMQIGDHVEIGAGRTKSMRDAIEAWQDEIGRRHAIGEVSGYYVSTMEHIVRNHVLPTLGGIKLHSLEREHVQALLDEKILEYAKETVVKMTIPIHGAIRCAIRKKWLKRNPLIDDPVRVPDKPKSPKIIPTKEQIQLVLTTISTRCHGQSRCAWYNQLVFFTLALFQGMRTGEICGLRWEDVDLGRQTISIRHSLSSFDGLKAPKTRAGQRVIDMGPATVRMLQFLRTAPGYGPATGHVYRYKGQPVRPHLARKSSFDPVMHKVGLTVGEWKKGVFSPHALRHAAISLLIEGGLQPLQARNFAGHKSITTTMDIYAHAFEGDSAAARVMGNIAGEFPLALGHDKGATIPAN